MTVNMFCLVLSVVLLLLAGLNCPVPPRVNLGWLGMFFFVLASVLTGVKV